MDGYEELIFQLFFKVIGERKKRAPIIVLKKRNINTTNCKKELDVHAMIFIGI
jgi:hypothetical protein